MSDKTTTLEDGPWYAGALGKDPEDDALVYRDDAVTGPQFYAASPGEARTAAAILNHQSALVARMVGATLRVEWSGWYDMPYDDGFSCCPECDAPSPIEAGNPSALARGARTDTGHYDDCPLDAAMREAGLVGQAARDEARRKAR